MKSIPAPSAVVAAACIAGAVVLAVTGKVDGTAVFGLLASVLGGVIVHAAGGGTGSSS